MLLGMRSGKRGTPPSPAAPVNTVAPVISGNPNVGSTLTASQGSWTGFPTPTYAYQWKKGGVDISGATSSTYVPVSGDLGGVLTVVVTATNTQGSATGTSAGTPAIGAAVTVPANTVAPTISGTTAIGDALTCSQGTWTGNPTPTYAYQWTRAGVDISGETASTHTLVTADAGTTIACRVTATNSQGSTSATATGSAIPALVAPSNSVAPAISGTANTGQTLTASTGTWSGNPAPTYSYQWNRAGTPISGATASTYLVVSADEGSTLTVTVTATNTQGSVSATSSATATVTAGPVAPSNTVAPAITGTAWEGATLTSSTGTWNGNPTPTYAYQWKRAGTNISGATSSTYQLAAADTGSAITVAVTATNSQGNATATSSATATVIVPPIINAAPAGSALYVAEGDSITLGNSPTLNSYATLFAGTDTTNITFVNKGSGGAHLTDLQSRAAVVDNLIASNTGKVNYVLSVFNGEAEIDNATYYPSNPSTWLADFATYCDARRAAGYYVIVCTFLPRSIGDANYEGYRQSCNTGLRTFVANGHADALIDFANDAVMGPQAAGANTTLISDGTHPTQTGQNWLERVAAPVLSAAMPIGFAPTISSVSITGTAQEGQTATAVASGATGRPSPTIAYQWKRNGTNISGATNSAYTYQAADVSQSITVTATPSNTYGTGTTRTSGSVSPIAAPVANLLLDTLSTSPSAAYSTRKLRSTYSGSALKVRRSSDSTTQDIGFDGSGNLDSTALLAFVGAGSGFVDTWYDQSGNANDVSQATTANQPRIVNAGTIDTLNSKPTLTWAAGANSNAINLARSTGFPSTFQTFVVAGVPAGTGSDQTLVSSGGTAAGGFICYMNGGTGARIFAGGFGPQEAAATQFSTLAKQASYYYFRNSTSWGIGRSGGQRTAYTTPPTITSTQIMLGNYNGLAAGFRGALPEVMIFGSMLSQADTALIDASHVSYWATDAGAFQDATIPVQTGYTAPTGYVAAASSEFDTTTYNSWHAFDQNSLTAWNNASGTTATISRQIPTAKTLTKYAVTGMWNTTPNDASAWTFEGSNDGSSWTVLDTRSGETGWAQGERRVYTIASGSRGSYTYHRLNITASNTSLIGLGELEFITN